MGSGFGEGDNRAQEAAQEAVSSPLLDDVSIKGAQGVLINITGGMDLAIDEVHQISTIIQEEAGDEAEIIFGAVHDPELEGQIRVTVIATGFDDVIRPDFGRQTSSPLPHRQVQSRMEQLTQQAPQQVAAVGGGAFGGGALGGGSASVVPLPRPPERVVTREQIGELDVPTFIRRQMD
jgi:cell division protein FtsZ